LQVFFVNNDGGLFQQPHKLNNRISAVVTSLKEEKEFKMSFISVSTLKRSRYLQMA
jgi:hypothetical protein